MLKGLLALLLVANLAFFAWSQGLLAGLLPAPEAQREPERLQRQVRPDLIRLGAAQVRVVEPGNASPPPVPAGPPAAATHASSSPPASPASSPVMVAAADVARPVCLETGFYSKTELARVEPELQHRLPEGSWRAQVSERPAGYVVHTGRFPDREALQRRQEELRLMNVEFVEMREPAELALGLSLGRFRYKENAERHLSDLEQRGVRGARVVPVGPLVKAYRIRLPAADAALQQRVAELPPRLMLERRFAPCADSGAGRTVTR